jgi:O-antigen ligase
MKPWRGGLRAAFLFVLLALSVFDYGRFLVVRLGVLRSIVFCAAAVFLWKSRNRRIRIGVYPLLVGGFALLALGHAFSSVYPWASFQHAVNIVFASVLLGWVYLLFREDAEGMWRRISLWIPAMATVQLAIAGWQRFLEGNLRPNGTFDNTNFLAEFLAVAALICLSIAFRRDETAVRRVSALAGAFAFIGGSFSLAASRGVLLAFVPAVAFLVVSRFGWRKGGKAFLFLVFPLLLVIGAGAIGRFVESDPYTYGRLLVWKSAGLTFLENPFGVGLGGFKYLWFEKQFPVEGTFLRYGNSAVYAHNEYLDVLVGLGAPGLLVFLAVLLYPLVAVARSWNVLREERKGLVAMAVSGLLLTGIHASFDFNFHEIGLVCVAATLTGILLAMLPEDTGTFRWTVSRWSVGVGTAAAALLLVVSVVTTTAGVAYRLGDQSMKKGDLDRAEATYRVAAWADIYRMEYQDALSLVYYRRYQAAVKSGFPTLVDEAYLTESIRRESSALNRSPFDYVVASRLAHLFAERYRLSGRGVDLKAALSLVGEAIVRNPYSPRLLLQRADLHLAGTRAKEAKEDLLLALSLEPNFCRGYAKLSEISARDDPGEGVMWGKEAAACRERAGRFPLKENERWAADLGDGK